MCAAVCLIRSKPNTSRRADGTDEKKPQSLRPWRRQCVAARGPSLWRCGSPHIVGGGRFARRGPSSYSSYVPPRPCRPAGGACRPTPLPACRARARASVFGYQGSTVLGVVYLLGAQLVLLPMVIGGPAVRGRSQCPHGDWVQMMQKPSTRRKHTRTPHTSARKRTELGTVSDFGISDSGDVSNYLFGAWCMPHILVMHMLEDLPRGGNKMMSGPPDGSRARGEMVARSTLLAE